MTPDEMRAYRLGLKAALDIAHSITVDTKSVGLIGLTIVQAIAQAYAESGDMHCGQIRINELGDPEQVEIKRPGWGILLPFKKEG